MSPTSFQTAPPRDIKLLNGFVINKTIEWMEKDSNLRRRCQQIYSLPPLATRESIHKADDRTRTDNLLITNQLLCQLSHIGLSQMANGWRRIRTFEGVANRFTVCPLWPLGNPSRFYGAYRARTCDPLLVRQMLSQLS